MVHKSLGTPALEEDVLQQKYIRLKIFSKKFSTKKILIVEAVNATVDALGARKEESKGRSLELISHYLLRRLHTFCILQVFFTKHTTKYETLTIHFLHFIRI